MQPTVQELALVASDAYKSRLQELEQLRARLRLQLPFILKPDVGQRGVGLKLIRNAEQLENYLRQTVNVVSRRQKF